jgi:transcription initiation factor TFIIIB Brf1 subunit/transcription initiation factor TFIIB
LDQVKETYNKFTKVSSTRSNEDRCMVFLAACVYIEGMRTRDDICSALQICNKDFCKAYDKITEFLPKGRYLDIQDGINSVCNALGLKNESFYKFKKTCMKIFERVSNKPRAMQCLQQFQVAKLSATIGFIANRLLKESRIPDKTYVELVKISAPTISKIESALVGLMRSL